MKFDIADATTFDEQALCTAMASAFSDYAIPVNLTVPAFRFMMKQRGLCRRASRIATVDGQIAAIWLVSIRSNKSYLISSGTVPACRGRGLATGLARNCISSLRDNSIETFQTEVLVENDRAASVYYKLGMTKRRDLSCCTITGPKSRAHKATVKEVPWSEISAATRALQDWAPSWQNSCQSINAIAETVRCFCTYNQDTLTGYAVLVPGSGSLLQIGVHPDARRQGVGTTLINHALAAAPNGELRLTNAEAADKGFAQFVQSFPARQTQGQFELIMPLNEAG